MQTVRMLQELAVFTGQAARSCPSTSAGARCCPFGEPSIAYSLANIFSGFLSRPAANAPAAPATNVVEVRMLKTRMKRLADRGDRAVQRLAEIEASITNLSNEDLLDLADIFKAEPRPPIGEMAFLEMARREISL